MKSYSQSEPPKLLTDAELEMLIEARRKREREHSQWDHMDVSGIAILRPQSDGRAECVLEQRFAHVAQRLTLLWRSRACNEYIHSILVMDREGRQGFPPEVVADLLMLNELNDRVIRMGSLDLSPPKRHR